MPTTLDRPDDTPNPSMPLEMQRRIRQWKAQNNEKADKYALAIVREWET